MSIYVRVAIFKKRLQLDASLYTLLQILSVTLSEKMQLHQALVDSEHSSDDFTLSNRLNLFAF